MKKIIFYTVIMLSAVSLGIYSFLQSAPSKPVQAAGFDFTQIKTVFLIMEENHNWSVAPSVNTDPNIIALTKMGGHAEQYYSPPGIHPSEPNYIWLEAGSNLGVTNDNDPTSNHQSTTQHLAALLNTAGVSWKAYQEDIPGTNCPLHTVGAYAPKHSGMIFFDDITGTNNPSDPSCISHYRPYPEFLTDLTNNTVARYNFITPNLNNDMHNGSVATGGTWLMNSVKAIMQSQAYKNNGAIFITWDESEKGNNPIGFLVISPLAKVNYQNTIHYTHSSLLRTEQEIFGVQPLLRDAANATDLADFFTGSAATVPTNPPAQPTPTTRPGQPTATNAPAPTNPPAPTSVPGGMPTPTLSPCCVPIPETNGTDTLIVNVPTAGVYKVWVRMMGLGDFANSVWVKMDDQCGINVGNLTGMPANTWTWVDYHDGNTQRKTTFNLNAGTHTLKLIGRDAGVKVDSVIVTQDQSCVPGTVNGC